MQFNIEMELNRQYCEECCKHISRWMLIYIRVCFWISIVLLCLNALLALIIQRMDLGVIVELLIWIICLSYFRYNFIRLATNLLYHIMNKRNHCGKVILEFSDDSLQVHFVTADETKLYRASDIKSAKEVKDFYKIILKGRYLYINQNNLSEQDEALLQEWMEMVNMGKRFDKKFVVSGTKQT